MQAVRPLSASVQTLQLQLRAAERRAALSEARAGACTLLSHQPRLTIAFAYSYQLHP